ncbi:hypothetical protein GMA19_01070 [Paenibacillus polymyxa E681]|nr:hypothetical protein GE561_01070 [Paenibacillus polymyxa E681]QNV60754.1 hypothetical protein GMA19_01070 [Paenibacillus polymyxa E681]
MRSFTLPFFIAKLLDKIGWEDEGGKHWNNTDGNISKIAEWIFGEGHYRDCGILKNLARKERGVLGLHDLLEFRLSCCSDRGGDMFNLTKSLSRHGGLNNPTDGILEDIVIGEMREISQFIYQIFENRYINQKINIFEEVMKLSSEDICGDSYLYIKSKLTDDALDSRVQEVKSRVLSFIIYQLGNTIYSRGIPCGYYDSNGDKDEQGINRSINEYLFETCFNPKLNEKGFDYFLYYLFLNYETTTFGQNRIATLNGFLKVLDKDQIMNYWREHKESIKMRRIDWEDKLEIGEYKTLYTSNVEDTYRVLDELLQLDGVSQADNESL